MDIGTKRYFSSTHLKQNLKNYEALPFIRDVNHRTTFVDSIGFNHTGDCFSIFGSRAEQRKIRTWSCDENNDVVTLKSCIEVSGSNDEGNCFYDSETNSVFNLAERKLENGFEISIQAFWLVDLENKFTNVDFGDVASLLTLSYDGINLYKCFMTDTRQDHFLVIFASGYKYGFKKNQVDRAEGSVVDLLQYDNNSLMHFKRIELNISVLDCGIDDFSQVFVDSTLSPNIYFYRCKEMIQLSHDGAQSFVYKNFEHDPIDFFKQCNDSFFVYVNDRMTAKLVNFQNGETQIIKEISLNLERGITSPSPFRAFRLYKKYNKLLLCTQNYLCVVFVVDLLSGQRVAEFPLEQPVFSIRLNWNMEELALTNYRKVGELSVDVFKIPQHDLSLKNLARLVVLTNFTKHQLLLANLPSSIKKHLALV